MGSAVKGYGTRKYYKDVKVVHRFKSGNDWYYMCIYPKDRTIISKVTNVINKDGRIEDSSIEERLGGNKEFLGA